ncbi:MAG: hypothetical protein IBX56_06760 [Methylomicrobium sp.]|nr:hypothetical protein [Methylomicrobium sp.]
MQAIGVDEQAAVFFLQLLHFHGCLVVLLLPFVSNKNPPSEYLTPKYEELILDHTGDLTKRPRTYVGRIF